MPRSSLLFVCTILATACAADVGSSAGIDTSVPAAPTKPAAKKRRVELTYEAAVTSAPEGAKEVDLWVPVAQDTAFQEVTLKNVTAPAGYTIEVEPTLGNKIFHVRVPATSLPLQVRFDYDVTRTERKTDLAASGSNADLTAGERSRYLVGTQLVPVGMQVSQLSGFQAHGTEPVAVAREAYDHVLETMKYGTPEGKAWGQGSTQYACAEGVGNCTDFHAYFMSLTRTNGIPARFLMGMSIPTDKKEGEIGGYHCWAEFFANGRGWIPVDISEADKVAETQPDMVEYYFGGLTVDRVEFTAGRDVMLVPPQQGPARNFFIYPYAEIDGKEAAKDAVTRKFTFKDV